VEELHDDVIKTCYRAQGLSPCLASHLLFLFVYIFVSPLDDDDDDDIYVSLCILKQTHNTRKTDKKTKQNLDSIQSF